VMLVPPHSLLWHSAIVMVVVSVVRPVGVSAPSRPSRPSVAGARPPVNVIT